MLSEITLSVLSENNDIFLLLGASVAHASPGVVLIYFRISADENWTLHSGATVGGVRAQGSSWALSPPVWGIPFPPPKLCLKQASGTARYVFIVGEGGVLPPSHPTWNRGTFLAWLQLLLACFPGYQLVFLSTNSFNSNTFMLVYGLFPEEIWQVPFVMVRIQVTIKLFNLSTQIIVIFHSFLLPDSCSRCGFHAARLQEARLFVIVKSSICESLNTNHCSLIDNSLCLYLISIFHV